jgi:hypothetical protein
MQILEYYVILTLAVACAALHAWPGSFSSKRHVEPEEKLFTAFHESFPIHPHLSNFKGRTLVYKDIEGIVIPVFCRTLWICDSFLYIARPGITVINYTASVL